MKDENLKFAIFFLILCVVIFTLGVGFEKLSSRPRCDWCYDLMYEEPMEIWQYKVCDKCYSELWDRTSADFGIEQKRERLLFIKNMIQDKQRRKVIGLWKMTKM